MDNAELEARLTRIEDTLAIDKLEKVYGYYLDNEMFRETVDLFSEYAVSIEIADRGLFRGKEGVRRFFMEYMARSGKPRPRDYFALHMQHQGVIDIAPDGRTAKGRWYCLMLQARPVEQDGPVRSVIGHGVYENEFVKEAGEWKFSKVHYNLHFRAPLPEGWAVTPVTNESKGVYSVPPDAAPTAYHPYPDMRPLPLHWRSK